jgi:8-oxo-dGTP pyrophosphatase MutT (NUDIX family)
MGYCSAVADETPRPAATVVVLRDGAAGPEAFMVRRHAGTAFRGAHVFPGGRVDAADSGMATDEWCDGLAHADRQLVDLPASEARAFHIAAARELFEEAGVLLARAAPGRFISLADGDAHRRFMQYRSDVHAGTRGLRAIADAESLRLALDSLVLFSHWVTPPSPIEGRRFDTRFFMTRVPAGQVPAHDDRETTEGVWLTPRDAIRRAAAREIVLPPPTWVTLRELEPHGSVQAALEWAAARRVVRREPAIVQESGARVLVMPLDSGAAPSSYERRFALRDGAWGPVKDVEETT